MESARIKLRADSVRKRGKCVDKTEIMRQCIALAEESAAEGEVPVGAAVVKNGEIIATGRNRRELDKNALCHAEIEAIDKACLHGWRLWEYQPCRFARAGARLARLQCTYGARDPKMRRRLKAAEGEVPVGAAVVKNPKSLPIFAAEAERAEYCTAGGFGNVSFM